MAKTAVLHIRIDPRLLRRIRRAAADDGRSVSDWTARALARLTEPVDVADNGVYEESPEIKVMEK